MINNQQRIVLSTGDGGIHHQPVSAKPSIVSVSSIDSDVSDRRDIREALYTGIFKRHRKTILKYLHRMHALHQVFAPIDTRIDTVAQHKFW